MDRYFLAIQSNGEYGTDDPAVIAIYAIPNFENWKNDAWIDGSTVVIYFDLYKTFNIVFTDSIPVPDEESGYDTYRESQQALIKRIFKYGVT